MKWKKDTRSSINSGHLYLHHLLPSSHEPFSLPSFFLSFFFFCFVGVVDGTTQWFDTPDQSPIFSFFFLWKGPAQPGCQWDMLPRSDSIRRLTSSLTQVTKKMRTEKKLIWRMSEKNVYGDNENGRKTCTR